MSGHERQCARLKDDPHQQHLLITDSTQFADAIFKQFVGNSKFKNIVFIKEMPYESKMEVNLDKFLDEADLGDGVRVAVTLKPCGPERLLSEIYRLMTKEKVKREVFLK